jgi:hypothetical protein
MATTLSLTSSGYPDAGGAPVTNTAYTSTTPLGAADSVTLSGGTSVTNVGLNTLDGADTLIISTAIVFDEAAAVAEGVPAADIPALGKITLGGGNDTVFLNSTLTGSTGTNTLKVTGSSGDDTLVLNAAATNTVISGGKGADAIYIKANVTGGQIAATGGSVTDVSQINDGADTIVIAAGVKGNTTIIKQFSISSTTASDTLIIGATFTGNPEIIYNGGNVITAADFIGSGNVANGARLYQVSNLANNDDLTALNTWLADGGNSISLI